MPIYQYVCADCDHGFEDLIFGDERPRCPECESESADKQLSVFATRSSAVPAPPVSGATPDGVAAGCGTCGDPRGPGACSL